MLREMASGMFLCGIYLYPFVNPTRGRKHCFHKGFGMIRELCIKQGGAVRAL
jgi:hypothetical protein